MLDNASYSHIMYASFVCFMKYSTLSYYFAAEEVGRESIEVICGGRSQKSLRASLCPWTYTFLNTKGYSISNSNMEQCKNNYPVNYTKRRIQATFLKLRKRKKMYVGLYIDN